MANKRTFRSRKYWWMPFREKILFLILIALFFLISPQKERQGVVIALSDFYSPKREALPLPTPAPYPVNITGKLPPSNLSAYGVSIVDDISGVVMYKKNDTEPLAPASTTKLMTALVVLDSYKLTDVVTISDATVEGQLMNLIPGEQMTVENLLYGMLIESGNDAATALALYYPKGYQGFIDQMNKKAKDLGLTATHFVNSVGLDDPNQTMSAQDLVRLSRIAIENPLIARIVSTPSITISDVDHKIFHKLTNVNELLGKIPGVAGIKTGWTEMAGENLSTLVERDGHKVVIVVLRSKDRFGDSEQLIDWVFNNHKWISYGL